MECDVIGGRATGAGGITTLMLLPIESNTELRAPEPGIEPGTYHPLTESPDSGACVSSMRATPFGMLPGVRRCSPTMLLSETMGMRCCTGIGAGPGGGAGATRAAI